MNIVIKISRVGICIGIFCLFACTSRQSNERDLNIDFKISPISFPDKNKVQLTFSFASDTEQKILMDWDALSVYDPPFEKDSILTRKMSIDELLGEISHSQFVIENESHERRLFSDIQLFEGETIEMKSEFKLEPKIDTIIIRPKIPVEVKSDVIDTKRLKIQESDSTVKLYYLFKPTDEQKAAGFKPQILSSNWFKLS